jgi:hypothetical protein
VVETVGLENRYTRKGIGGSNPSLSAMFTFLVFSRLSVYTRLQSPTSSTEDIHTQGRSVSVTAMRFAVTSL